MFIIKVKMEKFDNDFDSLITYNLSKTDTNGNLTTAIRKYIFPKEKSKFLKSAEDIFSTNDTVPDNINKSEFSNQIINYILNLNRSVDLNYDNINKYFDNVLESNIDFENFIGEADVSYIKNMSAKNIENYEESLEDGHIVNKRLEAEASLEEYEEYGPEEEFDGSDHHS